MVFMNKRQLGKSDLYVSEIGLGCMTLGTDGAKAVTLLESAVELGVTFFDTADLYDKGENERLVGKALAPVREKVVIATKVGNRWNDDGKSWRWDPSKAWIKEGVQRSLERLQTDYIDLYQLHGGTLDDPIDEATEAFEEIKSEGLIRAYGISSIRPNVIREWLGRSNLTSVMMQYSLLDRRPEETVLDFLAQKGVSVIARGPVAKGLLADKPAASYLDHSEQEVEKVQQGLDALVTPERSKGQLALRYALSHPAVATVIPGASRIEQLEENVGAAQTSDLSQTELASLHDLSRANRYENHR